MRRSIPILGALGALGALLFATAPVAAQDVERFSFDDLLTRSYPCGVSEWTDVHVDGADHFGPAGWQRAQLRFRYATTWTSTSGDTVAQTGRQIAEFTAETGMIRGQGLFIRIPGDGAILLDVGRLVFDTSTGTTLAASAQVLEFDDPATETKLTAAVCGLFD